MKQVVSKISAEKDGVFFVRPMTDVSVIGRTTIEFSLATHSCDKVLAIQ